MNALAEEEEQPSVTEIAARVAAGVPPDVCLDIPGKSSRAVTMLVVSVAAKRLMQRIQLNGQVWYRAEKAFNLSAEAVYQSYRSGPQLGRSGVASCSLQLLQLEVINRDKDDIFRHHNKSSSCLCTKECWCILHSKACGLPLLNLCSHCECVFAGMPCFASYTSQNQCVQQRQICGLVIDPCISG